MGPGEPLEPPDSHHVQAADGWLKLGDTATAEEELRKVNPALAGHPDVLQAWWRVHSERRDWPECIRLATAITHAAPGRRFGWLHLSHSLHEAGRTAEAYETLRMIIDEFPVNATMPFYLARFATRLELLEEARMWLRRAREAAVRTDSEASLKEKAMGDPDLQPLRSEIAEW